MSLRRANRPITDDKGYVEAIVAKVAETEVNVASQKTMRELDDELKQMAQVYEVIFQVDGSNKPLDMSVIMGKTINAEPMEKKRIGKRMVPIYNKVTTVMLGLEVLSEQELKDDSYDLDDVLKRFLAMEGEKVRFKVGRNKGFFVPDLRTLEPLKT